MRIWIQSFQYLFIIYWILAGSVSVNAQDQGSDTIRSLPGPDPEDVCTLDETGYNAHFFHVPEQGMRLAVSEPASEFQITFESNCNGDTWPSEAIQAFEHAADIWATHIASDIPIRVRAIWEDIENNALGSAAPTRVIHGDNFPEGRSDTWYAIANASSISGVDENKSEGPKSGIVSYINHQKVIENNWQLLSNTTQELVNANNDLIHLFSFDGVYRADDNFDISRGYWVKSESNETVQFRGGGLDSASVGLNPGWNLIDSLSDTIDVISIMDPDDILTDASVFKYNPEAMNYEIAETIVPNEGYWIYSADHGTIEMKINHPESESMEVDMQEQEKQVSEQYDKVIFSSGPSVQHVLISENYLTSEQKMRYLLPPLAPEPQLDIRTRDGYRMADRNSNEISMTVSEYPVYVDVEKNLQNEEAYRLKLRNGDQKNYLQVSGDQTARIDQEYEEVILQRISEDELVVENKLSANYPNPFNPATNIHYQIAHQQQVKLEVYDSIGRRVQVLVNELQQPGEYTVQFDGRNLASGLYFIRMQAGPFEDVQKMTLIK